MRKTILIGVGAFMLAGAATATDLRGRVDARNSYTTFPVGGTAVSLYREEAGRSNIVQSAYTAPNGMYYFRGVAPGRYTLRVEQRSFQLDVGNAPLQDLRPIVITR